MDRLPPIPSPPGTVFREFRVTVVPYLTFAALIGLAAFLWRSYEGPTAIVGEAEMRRSMVSSTQPGKIARILVGPLERVRSGQPVAEVLPFDPRTLEAQAALSRARLEFVRSGVEPRLRRDNNQINYMNLRLDWMRDRVELAGLKAQLAFFEFEYDRVRRLQGTNNTPFPVSSIFELQVAERDLADVRARIEEQSRLVADVAAAFEVLDQDLVGREDLLPDSIRAAIAVEERALQAIEDQLRPLPLTAPMDGVISSVHRHDGENILAGEPILTISAEKPDHIVAFVRQPISAEPAAGQKVRLRSRGRGGQSAETTILRAGTQMEPVLPELLPVRAGGSVSIDPLRPAASPTSEYGLPILVAIPEGFRIFPGELVDLHLTP